MATSAALDLAPRGVLDQRALTITGLSLLRRRRYQR